MESLQTLYIMTFLFFLKNQSDILSFDVYHHVYLYSLD